MLSLRCSFSDTLCFSLPSFFLYFAQVEEAIETKELPAYLEKSNLQIADLVQLVRTDLQAGVRIAVEALIVLDVHGECGARSVEQ